MGIGNLCLHHGWSIKWSTPEWGCYADTTCRKLLGGGAGAFKSCLLPNPVCWWKWPCSTVIQKDNSAALTWAYTALDMFFFNQVNFLMHGKCFSKSCTKLYQCPLTNPTKKLLWWRSDTSLSRGVIASSCLLITKEEILEEYKKIKKSNLQF